MTCVLTYRPRVMIDELKPGECTIHRCSNASNERWWQLWFLVPRDTDGALDGSHAVPSIWHHIVVIVGVPDGEAWQKP